MNVGGASAAVALTGVALPFGLGYVVATAFGLNALAALVVGAAMTATSVGITARVLSDLGRLNDPEGQVVLGAAVIDDVIGLIILAVVAQLVAGTPLSVLGVTKTTVIAFGFLAIVLILGRFIAPPLFAAVARYGRESTLAAIALAFGFVIALAAESAGSALIIGAFAAGLIIQPTKQAHDIEKGIVRLGHFFVPIFFVSVGAAVDVSVFAQTEVVLLGSALVAMAVIGKFAAGYAPVWFKGRKNVIGMGMIPRGEVGLIFAQTGITAGVLTNATFGAVMMMVMVTTFIAPPGLKYLLRSDVVREPDADTGIGELTNEA